jgi:nitrogen fixation-related uncharacterized protein
MASFEAQPRIIDNGLLPQYAQMYTPQMYQPQMYTSQMYPGMQMNMGQSYQPQPGAQSNAQPLNTQPPVYPQPGTQMPYPLTNDKPKEGLINPDSKKYIIAAAIVVVIIFVVLIFFAAKSKQDEKDRKEKEKKEQDKREQDMKDEKARKEQEIRDQEEKAYQHQQQSQAQRRSSQRQQPQQFEPPPSDQLPQPQHIQVISNPPQQQQQQQPQAQQQQSQQPQQQRQQSSANTSSADGEGQIRFGGREYLRKDLVENEVVNMKRHYENQIISLNNNLAKLTGDGRSVRFVDQQSHSPQSHSPQSQQQASQQSQTTTADQPPVIQQVYTAPVEQSLVRGVRHLAPEDMHPLTSEIG